MCRETKGQAKCVCVKMERLWSAKRAALWLREEGGSNSEHQALGGAFERLRSLANQCSESVQAVPRKAS